MKWKREMETRSGNAKWKREVETLSGNAKWKREMETRSGNAMMLIRCVEEEVRANNVTATPPKSVPVARRSMLGFRMLS